MAVDLAVVGARVRTMDPSAPWATAVAVTDGVIVAVGSDAEVRERCDAGTEVLDAGGAAVTPGLVDSHQHLLTGAEVGRGLDLDRVADLDGVRAALAAERRRVGDGWVLGFALEYSALGGRRWHHDLVDDATGPCPMLLYALDLHTGFANAAALRAAGIDGARSFPDGASIVCDDDGRPTGELRERSAIELVSRAIPVAGRAERLGWYRDAIARQNAVGITAIHQMDGDDDTAATLAALDDEHALGLRVALHYWIGPDTDDEAVDAILRGPRHRGRRWSAGGVKLMLDGVIETGTAWLEDPDEEGGGRAAMWPDIERFRRTVAACHRAGLRIATHAIGDRAVREVLDAYASLPARDGAPHRIEHIETAPDTTVARFAPQRVTASMQPIHLRWMKPDLSDPWSQRLGLPRCQHVMRSGDLSAAGALVVLGSDWPVAPFDPRLGLFAARARRPPDSDDERAIGASRPLSGEEALAGYTRNAAEAIGEEGVAGMLRPGYRADLVAWGEDPADCPVADLPELPVLATVVGGEVVHRAGP